MLTIIDEQLIVAHPITNGFSWTLSSRLGQMLMKAENEFGQRDQTFTVLGIEFKEGNPQIWFPGNCGHVVVQLSLSAMQDPNKAIFQLAHECVHLLNPCSVATNNLEEGVATHFSLEYMQTELGIQYQTGEPKYDEACRLVRELIAKKGDSIRELRKLHGPLNGIKEQDILTMCPSLNANIANQLASLF